MNQKLAPWIFILLFAVMMSIPWLVPHAGWLSLIAFVPLLFADDMADYLKVKRFWLFHYCAFVLWNSFTTFWVCNATVGGGIFAVLANSLQMSVIWGLFRFSKKRLGGAAPYIFLAAAWIAWEKFYFNAEISWPWLVLGNAFARNTHLVQWYEYTGVLGGSLWVWSVNLAVFGLLSALASGRWFSWNGKGRAGALVGLTVLVVAPVVCSLVIYSRYEEKSEGSREVLIAQPNFDPYEKFESLSQEQQNTVLMDLCREAIDTLGHAPDLILAPETFTNDLMIESGAVSSRTVDSFNEFLQDYPQTSMLYGASSYEIFYQQQSPDILARKFGEQSWYLSHNSAVMQQADGIHGIFHKSKLVVGTELTPYPRIFVPLDNWLSAKMGVGGLMGRCAGQDRISILLCNDTLPVGCAVCYESIYGEYCTGYVRSGAKFLTVITNDAWWGNTPGYRQHMSYSRLRAIETRRDIARCGNTGISAIIDQKGDVVERTGWWTRTTLAGTVNLNSEQTFFVRNGDLPGRACTFMFLLLLALALTRRLMGR